MYPIHKENIKFCSCKPELKPQALVLGPHTHIYDQTQWDEIVKKIHHCYKKARICVKQVGHHQSKLSQRKLATLTTVSCLRQDFQYYFQMSTNERKITSFPCDYWFKECKIYVMLFMFTKEESQRAKGVKKKQDITSKCTKGKENLAQALVKSTWRQLEGNEDIKDKFTSGD